MTNFTEILLNTLLTLNSICELFLGDFNIDVLKYDSSYQSQPIALFVSGFLHTITKPTRCTVHSATLMDHTITDSMQSEYNSLILTK